MKKTLAAATVAALAGLAGTANAADVYSGGGMKDVPVVAPIPMWTGFYIGGHLGAGWADIKTDRNNWNGYTPPPCKGECETTPPSYDPVWGGDTLNSVGAFGGAQLGYNWQATNFVLGIEVDLGGMSDNLDHGFYIHDNFGNSLGGAIKSEGGFYGDVTGRIGYTWGPALLYAKGGFAWLETDFKVSAQDNFGSTWSRDFNNTLTGWTVGGGLEYMLSPHWTMKIEYLFFDFQNCDNNWNWKDNLGNTNDWHLTNKDLEISTVKLGFNYLWNASAPVPLK